MKHWGAERSFIWGASQTVCSHSLNTCKLEFRRNFFPEKIAIHSLVRGTISFYREKLQLLPAGESEMWNVSMQLNEQG